MAKKPATKKTAARKPATKKPVDAVTAEEAAPVTEAKPKKAKAKKPAAKPVVDTRIITMHRDTRLIHRGDGEKALAAFIPTIDAVNTGGRAFITSVAYDAAGTNIHVVPVRPAQPDGQNPGVVLTISGNGHASFDHVSLGLATPALIIETTLSVMDAVRPDEGAEPGPVGRRPDWFAQATLAAETVAERFATA